MEDKLTKDTIWYQQITEDKFIVLFRNTVEHLIVDKNHIEQLEQAGLKLTKITSKPGNDYGK